MSLVTPIQVAWLTHGASWDVGLALSSSHRWPYCTTIPPEPWTKELPQLVAPAQHTQNIKHNPHPCSGTTACPVLPCTAPEWPWAGPCLVSVVLEHKSFLSTQSQLSRKIRCRWPPLHGENVQRKFLFFIPSLRKKPAFFLIILLTSTATSWMVTFHSQTSLTLGIVAGQAEEVMDIAILLLLLEHLLDFSSQLLICVCSHWTQPVPVSLVLAERAASTQNVSTGRKNIWRSGFPVRRPALLWRACDSVQRWHL